MLNYQTKKNYKTTNVLVLLHSHVIGKIIGGVRVNNNVGFILTSEYNKATHEIIYNKYNL